MATINIIVPPLWGQKPTGGIWCIFEYVYGLSLLGHTVSVIPMLPSPEPEWFPRLPKPTIRLTRGERFRAVGRSLRRTLTASLKSKSLVTSEIRGLVEDVSLLYPRAFSHPMRLGIAEAYVSRLAPFADINIATSFETVRPTALLPGNHFYFGQHYEPYFANELQDPVYAAAVASQSYHLGFTLIANSSWLQQCLHAEVGDVPIHLCPNAIDHSVFFGQPKLPLNTSAVVVISYGGRNAQWKGFREMAEAVALVRANNPELRIEWRVYGDALLPPDNPVAPYQSLGYLRPAELSQAYRDADMLLSASWYESFPLFPIEAMACGLPVITSQAGTEEYAIAGKTAEVIEAKSVASIAAGLQKLISDKDYRRRIAIAGNDISRQFTWAASSAKLNSILSAAPSISAQS